ncbi:MAG: hypothetical protein MUF45_15215 [Spirosomaceae bacterium]|nr:hypothetical protein [Spirosomataceae bacterium]
MQTQAPPPTVKIYSTNVINKKTEEHINLTPFYNFLERYSHTTTDASHVIDSVARGWVDGNPEINEANVLEVLSLRFIIHAQNDGH